MPSVASLVFMRWMVVVVVISFFVLVRSVDGGCDRSSRRSHLPQAEEAVGICQAMVAPWGYRCHEFEVSTKDGYILSMQRIPRGRVGVGGDQRRTPVLLQHGILMDGIAWLLNPPEQSLAFILADYGFDVWIANTRGTRWSNQHVSLDPHSRAYWNWSWDELVAYDLPATVEFVYGQSGQKLHYVGHSLGTLIALASFSEGKLVDKLRSAALLTPIAYLSHMTTPVGILAANAFIGKITTWLGISEFNPKGPEVARLLNTICLKQKLNCYDLLPVITGMNCCLNASTLELFLRYEPQPTSTRTLVHLAQNFRYHRLAKYDYENIITNFRHYGWIRPPSYNLENIPKNIPLFLSHGGRDMLSDVKDVVLLLDKLKADNITVQFVRNFAHADFVLGTTAKEVVYDAMITFFSHH